MRISEIGFRSTLVLIFIFLLLLPFEGPRPFKELRTLVESKTVLLERQTDPETGKEVDYLNVFLEAKEAGKATEMITLRGERQITEYWIEAYRKKETSKLFVYDPLSWEDFSKIFQGPKLTAAYAYTDEAASIYVDSGKKTKLPESRLSLIADLMLAPISFLLILFGAYTYYPCYKSAQMRAVLYVAIASALGMGVFMAKSYFRFNMDVLFLQQYIKDISAPSPYLGSPHFTEIACGYLAFVAIVLAIVYPKRESVIK